MANLAAKWRIKKESIERVQQMCRGDQVTNICASERNPRRHATFVAYVRQVRKNRYGVKHVTHLVRCAGGGNTWLTDVCVVHPGHLSMDEAAALYKPVHAAEFDTVAP